MRKTKQIFNRIIADFEKMSIILSVISIFQIKRNEALSYGKGYKRQRTGKGNYPKK